ncbi:MAG: DUF4214 domain-containing protein [Acidimicrobiales bacterium]|nr:DUF4214 domain-containing protein [Acidimicrobiales bacterium]
MAPNANLHRRRKRRVLGTLGGALVAWGALAGLPLGADPARPGEMHTEILTLTGADAGANVAGRSSQAAATTAGVGWSTRLEVDEGTQAVASSWTDAPDGAVEVRGLGDGGWTEWTELEAEEGEGPDDSARDTGGMAWFGSDGVHEVELRVTAGELHDLELQTMRYEAPSASSLTTAVAGADAAQPTIIPRSTYTSKGWASGNSGCSGGPTTASGGVKFAVVHHTVNSNTYSAADVPALLASIYAYHTGTNGWCDIAYNFVVDRFGRIWEGRSGGVDKAIVGGHAQGFNTGSVGVSFLGQYEPSASPTAANPTTAAIDAAGKLIGWKLGLYGIDPTGSVTVTSGGSNRYPSGTSVTLKRVIGHRDVGYTACPGQNLYDELDDIRTIAKAAQGGSTTTTTTAPTTTTTTPPPTAFAPFTTASQLVAQQYRDVLRREATADDLAFWTARVGDTWSPGQFIAHLQSSTEADNRVHAVTRLYRAYFLRNPDHNGLTYWLNRRGEGRSLVSISNSFAVSSEFTNRYGKLSNRAFVDRVYLNVLGRAADAGGATYWTNRLDAGMSRGQVMANFSQSSEYIRDTDDAVWVVGTYEGLLRRAPSTDVFTLFTAGLANGAASLTSISTYVFESSEYRSRFS